MIHYKVSNEHIEKAVFSGKLDDLTAEILSEVSVLYGTLKLANEDAAREFKRNFIGVLLDKEGRQIVFSDKLAKWLVEKAKKNGGVAVTASTSCDCDDADEDADKDADKEADDLLKLLEKIMSDDGD